jgi:anti-anti-sigma factor
MEIIDAGAGFRLMGTRGEEAMRWQVFGDLDLYRSTRLKEVVEGWVRAGWLCHTVDLRGTRSLDSSGIRHLIGLHKLLRNRGELRVCALAGRQPGQLLASTGASRILHVEY